MSKATQATAAIKAAWAAVSEITCPISVHDNNGAPEVHVLGKRALEQIPGQDVRRDIGFGMVEVSRMCDGVRFYMLMGGEG